MPTRTLKFNIVLIKNTLSTSDDMGELFHWFIPIVTHQILNDSVAWILAANIISLFCYILSSFQPTFQISQILYTTEMCGQVISLLLLHDWQVLGKCQLAHAETLLNQCLCGLKFSKINNKNMDQSCCWPSHREHWQQLKVQCTPLLRTRYTLAHLGTPSIVMTSYLLVMK